MYKIKQYINTVGVILFTPLSIECMCNTFIKLSFVIP
jgi:hypothetical protein